MKEGKSNNKSTIFKHFISKNLFSKGCWEEQNSVKPCISCRPKGGCVTMEKPVYWIKIYQIVKQWLKVKTNKKWQLTATLSKPIFKTYVNTLMYVYIWIRNSNWI